MTAIQRETIQHEHKAWHEWCHLCRIDDMSPTPETPALREAAFQAWRAASAAVDAIATGDLAEARRAYREMMRTDFD